jgi:hypothetical protein
MHIIANGGLVIGLAALTVGFLSGTLLGHRLGSGINAIIGAMEARLAAVEHMLGIGAGTASKPQTTTTLSAGSKA